MWVWAEGEEVKLAECATLEMRCDVRRSPRGSAAFQ